MSIDLSGVRHGPGGQASMREKWVNEAKQGARYTSRAALGRLSHALPRELSLPLVNAAVDTKYRNWTDLRWGRWCMERHEIVSMRLHDMVRRGNEGASTRGMGREWHLPERRLSPRPLNPAVWAYTSRIDRPGRG